MSVLVCPKCLGRMRTVERNGVVFERCEECGGVFLDRGELELLIRAEGSYYDKVSSASSFERHDDDEEWDRGSRRGKKKKKLRHFLEELLDFD